MSRVFTLDKLKISCAGLKSPTEIAKAFDQSRLSNTWGVSLWGVVPKGCDWQLAIHQASKDGKRSWSMAVLI